MVYTCLSRYLKQVVGLVWECANNIAGLFSTVITYTIQLHKQEQCVYTLLNHSPRRGINSLENLDSRLARFASMTSGSFKLQVACSLLCTKRET